MSMGNPQFTEQDAIRLARERYGMEVAARPLPSERDRNVHLTAAGGREYVLKIANAAEDRAVLEMQNAALAHVATRLDPAPCQQLIPTESGTEIAAVPGLDGQTHWVRLLTYLPGSLYAHARPQDADLLRSLGQMMGQLTTALSDFHHPAARRDFYWDLRHAGREIRARLHHLTDAGRWGIISHFLNLFEQQVLPALPALRTSVIHNDANDYNLVVGPPALAARAVIGLLDWGDMVHSCTVCELAVTLAYALLDQPEPLAAAAEVVRGFHHAFPLTEREIELLFPLACARLAMSVTICAHQQKLEPDNAYLSISGRPAWAALEQLQSTPPELAHYTFRAACNLEPCPSTPAAVRWLEANRDQIAPITPFDLRHTPVRVLDQSVGSTQTMAPTGGELAVGRHGEARWSPVVENPAPRKTVDLSMALHLPAGTPVFAALDGRVHHQSGPEQSSTLVLRYEPADGVTFFLCYRQLDCRPTRSLHEGGCVRRGQQLGVAGTNPLYIQLASDLPGGPAALPSTIRPEQCQVWLSICPDPNLLLQIPAERFPPASAGAEQILARRDRHIGPSLSISYRRPLHIVRGYMQYLYDADGRAYLDAVNNVPHVGHSHPRVVAALQQQSAVLNTNTRYLHPLLVEYAEQLCATLPEPLRVCYFVCSGSEANELALRLARAHTGRRDLIVIDGAYHGNTAALVEISPYKFNGPGGSGRPPRVHIAPLPDPYRGPYKRNDPTAGARYATGVGSILRQLGAGAAAFIGESLLGCGGQIVLPQGYLQEVYRQVRAAGGVCIADEVQVGFGRVGTHFWGFQTQNAVPDIVTLGKPMGNGHPLAAVITTPEIAASFATGMEYFNTYGGNPVSCAVGLAVLEVIEEEGLQQNALDVGGHLLSRLTALQEEHPIIGDVRGLGLFIGIELVLDRDTLAPAADQASYIINRIKDRCVLISTDGPLHNVLKIKPPLVFTRANADYLVDTLDEILREDFCRTPSAG